MKQYYIPGEEAPETPSWVWYMLKDANANNNSKNAPIRCIGLNTPLDDYVAYLRKNKVSPVETVVLVAGDTGADLNLVLEAVARYDGREIWE